MARKRLKICHSTKYTNHEWDISYADVLFSACATVEDMVDDGGFWAKNSVFIPYHRINYIEVEIIEEKK